MGPSKCNLLYFILSISKNGRISSGACKYFVPQVLGKISLKLMNSSLVISVFFRFVWIRSTMTF